MKFEVCVFNAKADGLQMADNRQMMEAQFILTFATAREPKEKERKKCQVQIKLWGTPCVKV